MPKISFVMPVKNGEKLVAQTIESLQNQTVSDLEIVVVNDHSEDDTENIVRQMAESDPRIKLINQDTDKFGVSAARNTGTKAATGEIIFPVDSDDPNFPNRAEVSLSELEKNDADVFYGNIERFYTETGERALRHFQDFDEKMARNINIFPHPASAFKKEIFDAVGGYDEGITIGEDYDFFLSALDKCYKFSSKNIALAQYTMHPGQLTTTDDPEKIKKRQEWNRIVRAKHNIFEVDPEYVRENANPEVVDFYINKNYDIWFGPESVPTK